jgi:chitodextrinase
VTPAATLGARAFRFTLRWTPGTSSLSAADVAELDTGVTAANGMRIVLAVYGTSGAAAPVDATGRDQYCAYVASALSRYQTIRDVVIWNEPNKRLFWNPQDNAPALYESLLARCYDALHASFPTVNVVGLALSSSGNDDTTSTSPGAFIRGVGTAYRASGRTGPLLDTVGFHPYPADASERPWEQHIGSKTIGEGDWNKLMYNLWLAFSGTGEPLPGSGAGLWYLEDGFQTTVPAAKASAYTGTENVATIPDGAGGEPDSPPPASTSPAPDQATQVLDAIRLAACQPYVGAFFNFLLADEPALTGWQSGALWADLTQKGSYAAFQQAISVSTSGSVDCGALKGGRPSGDFMPPSTPVGVTAAPQASPLAVTLSWSPSSDDSSGVVAYWIYRGGAKIGASTSPSWTDTSVSQTTTYSYAVRALDAAGNLGDSSATVAVTTPDATPPSTPANLSAQPSADGTAVALQWTGSSDNVGVAGYQVSRGGTALATVAGTSYNDSGLTPGTAYTYAVVAVDAAGNRSSAATATVTLPAPSSAGNPSPPSTAPPSTPLPTTASPPAASTASPAPVAEQQAAVLPAVVPPAVTVPAPAPLTPPAAVVRLVPTAPAALHAHVTRLPAGVRLTWRASREPGGKVAGYRIYRGGRLIATVRRTSFFDERRRPTGRAVYAVVAFDPAGSTSARSTITVARR